MTTQDSQPDDIAYVTVVESPACHFCIDAQGALAELSSSYPLVVATIDIRSSVGMLLVQKHGASMSPLVLLDGQFFSHGRLPRQKLAALLHQRFGQPAGTRAV